MDAQAEALSRAEKAEKRRDDWERSYDALLRTAPSVSKNELKEAILRGYREAHPDDRFDKQVELVWKLYEGTDPAVYVVRKSDIAAVEVQPIDGGKWWLADGALVNMCESPTESEAQEAVDDALATLVGALAARRAIEAEQAVDPVEARALELFHLAYPGEYALTGSMETCRRIAEAEARQEADQ